MLDLLIDYSFSIALLNELNDLGKNRSEFRKFTENFSLFSFQNLFSNFLGNFSNNFNETC